MAPFVGGLRARGFEATAIDLPRRKAEEALPAFHAAVPDDADVVVGGHSFGGRVASLAAAEPDAPYAALVLFSYPLHPPGSPGARRRPDRALAADPLPRPAAVRASPTRSRGSASCATAVRQLPDAELVTYPKLGHTLKPVLDDALDRVAAFLHGVAGSG